MLVALYHSSGGRGHLLCGSVTDAQTHQAEAHGGNSGAVSAELTGENLWGHDVFECYLV